MMFLAWQRDMPNKLYHHTMPRYDAQHLIVTPGDIQLVANRIVERFVVIWRIQVHFSFKPFPKPKAWHSYACGDVVVIWCRIIWYEKTAGRAISPWDRPASVVFDLSCLWDFRVKRKHWHSCRRAFHAALHIVWDESIRWFGR